MWINETCSKVPNLHWFNKLTLVCLAALSNRKNSCIVQWFISGYRTRGWEFDFPVCLLDRGCIDDPLGPFQLWSSKIMMITMMLTSSTHVFILPTKTKLTWKPSHSKLSFFQTKHPTESMTSCARNESFQNSQEMKSRRKVIVNWC